MAIRSLSALAGAAAIVLAVAGCSSSDGTTAGTPPSATGATSASPSSSDVCGALAQVKSDAATVQSDVQAKNLTALSTDLTALKTSVEALIQEATSSAQAQADAVRSAWDDVTSTFAGLDKKNLAQARSTMQGPVEQMKTALDGLGSDLSCS